MKLRQSPRIKDFTYVGSFVYNLTFVTRAREPRFESTTLVNLCLGSLKDASSKYGFRALAFCFMPDYLHLLVAGENESSLGDFARLFKQLTGYRFKRDYGAYLWQISYYDHVVRREEQVDSIANYIWDNPVRAGLVMNRLDYPFSGPRELMEQA